jgi:hypothetical protein
MIDVIQAGRNHAALEKQSGWPSRAFIGQAVPNTGEWVSGDVLPRTA